MIAFIEKFGSFVNNKRVQSFSKTLVDPVVDAVGHAETAGFSLLRPFPKGTAYPIQGRKYRSIPLIHHRGTLANRAAMRLRIFLLNLFQGLTCKPVREPKLYYTDTSFDAILVRVGQFSLGGRGLTYFFLTYFLPFLILCNSSLISKVRK